MWGRKFIIYGALGIPKIDLSSWKLRVDGLVENPIEYSYDQLTSMPQTRYVKSFHCVTQWSIKDVEVSPEAKWVMFHTVEGYSSAVPVEDGLKEDALMAFKLNGKPLSPEQGFPARPFMPSLYAWKSAKWVNRIELMKDYRDGYWEQYRYHERGNVWEEERFKGHSGTHQRHRAFGTA